jgi:hypothetical protein
MASNLNKGMFITVAKKFWSGSTPTLRMYQSTAATWKKGEPLIKDTTTDLSLNLAKTTAAIDVVGISLYDAQTGTTNATDTYIEVALALAGTVFEANIAGDAGATLALASSHMFKSGQLMRDTTNNIWYLNNTSGTNVYIIGLKDDTGTVNGRVYFTFSTSGRHLAFV